MEAKANSIAQCGKSRRSEPEGSHRRNPGKRFRTKQVQNVQWAISRAPRSNGDIKVQLHDTRRQEFGQICQNIEVVSADDTRALRESYNHLTNRHITVFGCTEDKGMIEELGRFVFAIQDHAMTLSNLYAYRSSNGDACDET